MKVVYGNLFDEIGIADVLLVTTNSYVNKAGCLTMGRGAALEAAERYRELPRVLGQKVLRQNAELRTYGVLLSRVVVVGTRLGAFQVKRNYRDRADLNLIRFAVETLCEDSWREYDRIVMNFPGTGFGQRTEAEVLPIIAALPDNVRVYKRESEG